jgi:putative FmdB family regulatory protein
MPLYEYECDSCGARFERIQKFSDPPVTVCPTCGGAVRKLLSSPAIQFKGSGFYITDYARSGQSEKSATKTPEGGKSETKSSGSADAASSTSSSSETGKSETKTETKGDSKPAPTKSTT